MNDTITIHRQIHFRRTGHGGRRRLQPGPAPETTVPAPGRVPRVARFMALALSIEERVRRGELRNYAEVALLGNVTRARVSQIMNLLNLAADIQEGILFLPRTQQGRDTVILRDLQPIASITSWSKQRVLWQQLARRITPR